MTEQSIGPRERARRALTVRVAETGSGTVSLSGITLTDMQVDLETIVADAIADAEAALEARVSAQATELEQLKAAHTALIAQLQQLMETWRETAKAHTAVATSEHLNGPMIAWMKGIPSAQELIHNQLAFITTERANELAALLETP